MVIGVLSALAPFIITPLGHIGGRDPYPYPTAVKIIMKTLANPNDLDALAARFNQLTPDAPARWGKMNPQQMAVHVGDASEMVLKQRPPLTVKRTVPPAIIRFAVFRVLRRFPRNVRTSANPAGQSVDRTKFTRDIERAIASLRSLAAAAPHQLSERHPALGRLTRDQWLRYMYMHTDHHLRQFNV
jgi:hypothetical protein